MATNNWRSCCAPISVSASCVAMRAVWGMVWMAAVLAIARRSEAVSFVGLGDLPGGSFFSIANGVSADGSVVVGRGTSASGTEAFRWTSGGGMIGLGDLAGGSFSSTASGVSADGSVVVGDGVSASGTEAFRWTSSGMVGLGDLAGSSFNSVARGVTADGSVVVGQSNSTSGLEAFRLSSGEAMVGLGDLTGGSFVSVSFAASADGSVIVGYSNSASGIEAFRWTSGGGMVGLGDLAGGSYSSQAGGVSADGSVIVGRGLSELGHEAFRWTSGGGMVALGDLPGGSVFSQALGVSADGSVVVGFGNAASGNSAFIWDEINGMQSLDEVLSPIVGEALDGWALTHANAISADGRTVVGHGTNPNGQPEAWLAYLADEIFWSPESSGSWDSADSWEGPFVPGAADEAVIDPTAALTVTGPSASQTVNKLTLGGSGVSRVTLRLAEGSLESLTAATFHADSELVLADGRVFAAPAVSNAGVIRGTGTLNADLTNNVSGEVRVAAGESLVVSGASHASAGKLEVIGGSLEFIGHVTNSASTGAIAGRNATLRYNGGLTNDGALVLSFGTSDVFGDVTNTASGTIAVAGNSNVTFYDDVTNSGALNVAGGSTAVFFGELAGNGNAGSGDVQALGDLAPGASPGVMQFGGDLTLGPLANFAVELGGLAAGSEFDQLVVAGDLSLGGSLAVSLIDDHTLSSGQEYLIADVTGALIGQFAGLGEGALVGAFGGKSLFISYAAGDGNDVALLTAPGFAADFDFDDDVDGDDLARWTTGFGTGDDRGDGDADLDGDVDGADFLAWQRQVGSNLAVPAAEQVPEPTALVLISLAFVGAGLRARRRQNGGTTRALRP